MMPLFNTGVFTLHSGERSEYKIDCDALSDEDIKTLAYLARHFYLPPYGYVASVPTGGLRLGAEMAQWADPDRSDTLLVVDDVLTTGQSITETLKEFLSIAYRPYMGLVIFDRSSEGEKPLWVRALFTVNFSDV